MEITLPLGDLVAGEVALDRLLEVKLPAKTAYHVAKLTRLAKVEIRHFLDQRDALVRELGATNGDGSTVQVTPENVAEFQRRLTELAAVDVTIAWGPLPFAELPAEIAAGDLLRLGALIADPAP
jgi:hypothetical protein